MARYRVAVRACALALSFVLLPAPKARCNAKDSADLTESFLGMSFQWQSGEETSLHTLVIVSENTAWWISEENRFRSVLVTQPWQPKDKDEIVWYEMRFTPVSLKIKGDRFTMDWRGQTVRGDVSRLRK